MSSKKVVFKNHSGIELSGRLDFSDVDTGKFALFAHCFTCNKTLNAVRNITKELVKNGFSVLQFDFTGLGDSDGVFEDTTFSGNVDDIIAAASFLEKEYKSPSLLIGHSLGGSAVVFAASKITSVKAFTTIGSPSTPSHVSHLFRSSLEEIKSSGEALVNIGGRDFKIKKEFVEDIERVSLLNTLKEMRKSFLIMHSPQDTTVGVESAAAMYSVAHHPKSFISLDNADHLLHNKEDSVYAGEVIAAWAKRYV